MRFLRYKSGWYGDNYRHSLAARGISSKRVAFANFSSNNAGGIDPEDYVTITEEFPLPGGKRGLRTSTEEKDRKSSSRDLSEAQQQKRIGTEIALEPFNIELEKIAAGDVAAATAAIGRWGDRKLQIQDAAVRGALAQAQRGDPIDTETLKAIGVNRVRIAAIERERRKIVGGSLLSRALGADKYSGETAGEATLGATKVVGMTALKGAEGIVATGLKNMRAELGSQPRESAIDKFLREKRESEVDKAAGSFNTFGIKNAFFSSEEGSQDKKMRMYPEAIRAEAEANSLYENRAKLAQVSLSGFTEGNLAYKTGNRENLIAAITKLEAEHARIKDNWKIVQDARGLVLSAENRDQSISRESDVGMFSNPLLGGAGASALDKQTKKISEVERNIMNSSNLLSARIGMLRNKLKRVNASIQPESTSPANVKLVNSVQTSFGEGGDGSALRINTLGDYLDNMGKDKQEGLK